MSLRLMGFSARQVPSPEPKVWSISRAMPLTRDAVKLKKLDQTWASSIELSFCRCRTLIIH